MFSCFFFGEWMSCLIGDDCSVVRAFVKSWSMKSDSFILLLIVLTMWGWNFSKKFFLWMKNSREIKKLNEGKFVDCKLTPTKQSAINFKVKTSTIEISSLNCRENVFFLLCHTFNKTGGNRKIFKFFRKSCDDRKINFKPKNTFSYLTETQQKVFLSYALYTTRIFGWSFSWKVPAKRERKCGLRKRQTNALDEVIWSLKLTV